ncbi:MAG TPA: diphthine--ammonia ligase [Thermoplasmata archaeon]
MARRRKTFLELASIKDKQFFCSWSGGKDCTLALFRAVNRGGIPNTLLTMLTEDGTRSRAHGLPLSFIKSQADSLGLSLVTRSTSWDDYEGSFISALAELREGGIEAGVFGDIDLGEHREWVERVCAEVGIEAYLPLWKEDRKSLMTDLLSYGFNAVIISVKDGTLEQDMLGRELNQKLVKELDLQGIDVSGEAGEYHTAVTSGPLFSKPLPLRTKGKVLRDGYWVLDVE